jgi:nucleoside diphosphate kinase
MEWTLFYIKLNSKQRFDVGEKIKQYTLKGLSLDAAKNKIMDEFETGEWR